MQLHYKKFGAGCPLIILHGLYGSSDNWYTFGQKLSEYFTVYLIDQRNHGNSPHSPELNYKVMTADLEEFITAENIDYACLLGHSMGGKVAMNYTLQNPSKVRKLVVIDIALRSYATDSTFAPQAYFHQKIVESLNQLDISAAKTRSAVDKDLSVNIPQKPLRQFLLKNLKRKPDGKFYWGLNLQALRNNLIRLLDGINPNNQIFENPVLVISGTQSGYINDEDKNAIYRVFPNAKILELDTGHWVHAEEPEKLLELLVEFLPAKEF
jgi:esterase